jgi:hypothetical protein
MITYMERAPFQKAPPIKPLRNRNRGRIRWGALHPRRIDALDDVVVRLPTFHG